MFTSVADPHHIDADQDLDPACYLDPYPNPATASHVDADQDQTFHLDADPDPSS